VDSPHSQVEQPIQILYLSYPTSTPGLAQPRSLVVVEAGSQLTLVEQYGGEGPPPGDQRRDGNLAGVRCPDPP
jgi:hypothetical protein